MPPAKRKSAAKTREEAKKRSSTVSVSDEPVGSSMQLEVVPSPAQLPEPAAPEVACCYLLRRPLREPWRALAATATRAWRSSCARRRRDTLPFSSWMSRASSTRSACSASLSTSSHHPCRCPRHSRGGPFGEEVSDVDWRLLLGYGCGTVPHSGSNSRKLV